MNGQNTTENTTWIETFIRLGILGLIVGAILGFINQGKQGQIEANKVKQQLKDRM